MVTRHPQNGASPGFTLHTRPTRPTRPTRTGNIFVHKIARVCILLTLFPFNGQLTAQPRASESQMDRILPLARQLSRELEDYVPRGARLAVSIQQDGQHVLLGTLLGNLLSGRTDQKYTVVPPDMPPVSYSPDTPDSPRNNTWTLSGTIHPASTSYLVKISLQSSPSTILNTWKTWKTWNVVFTPREISGLLLPVPTLTLDKPDPYEPNNSPGNPARITQLPQTISNLNLASFDQDWFAFSLPPLPADKTWKFSAATTGIMDTVLNLYTAQNTETPLASSDDTNGRNAALDKFLEGPGPWLLSIRSFARAEAGSYGLTLNLNTVQKPPQPQNTDLDSAIRLVPNKPAQSFTRYTRDDSQWYKISLEQPLGGNQSLSIHTRGSPNLSVTLLDASQKVLSTSNQPSSSAADPFTTLETDRLLSGTYYVRVSGPTDRTTPMPANYTISARIHADTKDIYENDNTFVRASVISPRAQPQTRSFSPPGDTDWAKFEIQRTGTWRISTQGSIRTSLELYTGSGIFLAESNPGTTRDTPRSQLVWYLSPGIYALRVTPFGYASPRSTYTLLVEPFDPPEN